MQIDKTILDFEDFGDEIVFINVKNGSYFSLKGKAVEVFRLMDKPCSEEKLLSLIADKYDKEEKERIHRVIESFETMGLLLACDGTEDLNWREDPKLGPTQFVEHNDIQDLIKLDPIHDVTDTGWPNAKPKM